MNKFVIYTDGSCWNGHYDFNKTSGTGFAYIFIDKGETDDDGNHVENLVKVDQHMIVVNHGTSNIAEINIIMDTLLFMTTEYGFKEIEIRTDSQYAIKVLTGKTRDKYSMYSELFDVIASRHKINLVHIPRNSDAHNKACDKHTRTLRLLFDGFLNDPKNEF